MGTNNILIRLHNITFAYPGRPLLFNNLDFTLSKGEKIGLIGANGCGKTTLFHIIMGLLKPQKGEVEIFGKIREDEAGFREIRGKVGLLFQDADDQLFCPTVATDVAFGPLNLRKTHEETNIIVSKTLETLGLSGFEDRITYNLSGGEKRLVSLATVMAMEPELLLLDEPTTVLDNRTTERITEVLNDSTHSCIIVSHDEKFLERTTNCTCNLNNGKIKRIEKTI